ncbi:putative selenoprotein domain-containing protein [Diaporthe ampelina]|uniref:Putative selenoprotein domain-containing protein n=1 Tax=Diaporthe ampelina TaxID=1214573 RepID=A0A0G2FI76_9PEZI|nr:putative selenoprotein domain-containing protein [Diaporthe ampelina]
MADGVDTGAPFPLPRVTIKFCTQCKWMLRAAYYAQELLSTFSTSLGEVALQPSTGGTFTVEIFHATPTATSPPSQQGPSGGVSHARTVLWDRKADGGFPETKELKRRVRDVIEPGRDLGHVDRNHARPAAAAAREAEAGAGGQPRQQGGVDVQAQQDRPSRAELEAAGPAGAGYPGSSEAAAALLAGGVQGGDGGRGKGAACDSKRECEDCD